MDAGFTRTGSSRVRSNPRSYEGSRRKEVACLPLEQPWRILTMTRAPDALRIATVVDYERTLILAIELSNTSWVLAAHIPGLPGVKAKRSIKPTPEALMAAIDGYRVRAEKAGRNVNRVIAVYEAGWSGFWLVRWLAKY